MCGVHCDSRKRDVASQVLHPRDCRQFLSPGTAMNQHTEQRTNSRSSPDVYLAPCSLPAASSREQIPVSRPPPAADGRFPGGAPRGLRSTPPTSWKVLEWHPSPLSTPLATCQVVKTAPNTSSACQAWLGALRSMMEDDASTMHPWLCCQTFLRFLPSAKMRLITSLSGQGDERS